MIASRRSGGHIPGTCKGGGATRAIGQTDEGNQSALHSRSPQEGRLCFSLLTGPPRTCAQHATKGYASSAFGLRIDLPPPALVLHWRARDPYGGNLEQAVLCVAPRGASPLHDDRLSATYGAIPIRKKLREIVPEYFEPSREENKQAAEPVVLRQVAGQP